jgi:hypothetical protein
LRCIENRAVERAIEVVAAEPIGQRVAKQGHAQDVALELEIVRDEVDAGGLETRVHSGSSNCFGACRANRHHE